MSIFLIKYVNLNLGFKLRVESKKNFINRQMSIYK